MPQYKVTALEQFFVSTDYFVEAASPAEAERLCHSGDVPYESMEVEEGGENWVETVSIEELPGSSTPPTGPPRDPRLQEVIDRLIEARGRECENDVQVQVDELIYERLGTTKQWSNLNNQGFDAQIDSLAEELGIETTVALVQEILTRLQPTKSNDALDDDATR